MHFCPINYRIFVLNENHNMLSKIVFVIPLVSLIYILQTFFFKSIKRSLRIPLFILAIAMFTYDAVVALYFFTSCFEMVVVYGAESCLSWIYPTLDFKIMVVISVFLLTLTLWALTQEWQRWSFYLIGAIVLYMGVVFRTLVFLQSIKIVSTTGTINSAIIFEFFTIMVVYGLVSAFIYIAVFSLGLFRPRTLHLSQEL